MIILIIFIDKFLSFRQITCCYFVYLTLKKSEKASLQCGQKIRQRKSKIWILRALASFTDESPILQQNVHTADSTVDSGDGKASAWTFFDVFQIFILLKSIKYTSSCSSITRLPFASLLFYLDSFSAHVDALKNLGSKLKLAGPVHSDRWCLQIAISKPVDRLLTGLGNSKWAACFKWSRAPCFCRTVANRPLAILIRTCQKTIIACQRLACINRTSPLRLVLLDSRLVIVTTAFYFTCSTFSVFDFGRKFRLKIATTF